MKPMYSVLVILASFMSVASTSGRMQDTAKSAAPVLKPNASDSSAKAAAPPRPIDALSWVIGGVWTADATKLGPGIERIETRYQWSDNNAYIRFTTHFVFDKGVANTYDGNFFWNPAQNNLAIWYMDAHNAVTEGPVKVAGDQWLISFRGEDFAGKMSDLRVTVTRKTNDDYRWALSEKQGDGWKELAALEYLRAARS
jgi:hypothetical protein